MEFKLSSLITRPQAQVTLGHETWLYSRRSYRYCEFSFHMSYGDASRERCTSELASLLSMSRSLSASLGLRLSSVSLISASVCEND